MKKLKRVLSLSLIGALLAGILGFPVGAVDDAFASIVDVSHSSFKLKVTEVSGADFYQAVIDQDADGYDTSMEPIDYGISTISCQPGHVYNVYVTAYHVEYDPFEGQADVQAIKTVMLTFTSLDLFVPPVFHTPAVSDITSDSITLTWTSAYVNNSLYECTYMLFLEGGGTTQFDTCGRPGSITQTYTFTGLSPNTEYKIDMSTYGNPDYDPHLYAESIIVRTNPAS